MTHKIIEVTEENLPTLAQDIVDAGHTIVNFLSEYFVHTAQGEKLYLGKNHKVGIHTYPVVTVTAAAYKANPDSYEIVTYFI